MVGKESHLRGALAEDLALAYLLKQNPFELLARNYRCRLGELDLVLGHKTMSATPELIFVEVRHREKAYFGSAAQSVTYLKRKKISLAARYFMTQKAPRYNHHWCRFDVVALSGPLSQPHYEWVQNAFNLC